MSVVGRNQQSVAGFDPVSLGGCALWLDAADARTLTLSGSNVTAWADKSGSNNNPTFGVNKPTYSATNRFVETSGLNQAFSIAGGIFNTVAGSIFMVFADKQENPTNGIFFGGLADYATSNFYSQSGLRNDGFSYALTGVSTPPAGFLSQINTKSTILYNQNYIYNSSNITAGINGTMYSMTSTFGNRVVTPSGGLAISGGVNWGGQTNLRLYEILFFNSILTTTQRQAVEGYLARKWTLQTNLPGTHPYKTFPPVYRDFSPLDLDGLSLWLDAADPNSLTLSGSNVSQWNDKSGNGRNATQSTGSNQPVYTPNAQNGLGSITFSNPSENTTFMNLPAFVLSSNNQLSVFVVVRCSSLLVNGGGLLGDINDYTVFYMSVVIAGYYLFIYSGPGIITGFNVANATNLLGGTYNGTTVVAYANGTSVGTQNNSGTGLTTSRTLRIASGITGSVSEILMYNTALSTTQRQQVEAYLARKWGLQSTVLARTTHPYRYGPAVVLPTQISGCTLWLDATDATTFTLSGSNVTQWRDKANGVVMTTQGTASNLTRTSAGINGLPSVYFNNSASDSVYMSGTLSNQLTGTAFYVIKAYSQRNVDWRPFLVWNSVPDGQFPAYGYLGNTTVNTVGPYTAFASPNGTPTQVLTAGSNYVISYAWGGTTTSVTTNGSTAQTGTQQPYTSSATALWLGADGAGATSRITLEYGEVLLFNTALTTVQRQQIEGYLAWKWGLQTNLPTSNHPFLLYKPVTPTFTPLQLSGLSLWLDAADVNGNGTSLSNGATVSSWVDKSGQGRTMTATTAGTGSVTYSTYGGVGSILFNSTSSNTAYMRVLNAVNLTNFTVFIIARSQSSRGNQPGLIGIPSASARASYDSIDGFGHYIDSGIGGGDPKDRFFGSGNANLVSNAATPGTDPYPLRLGVWTNSSTGALNSWINGAVGSSNLSGSNRTSSASGFGIGFETGTGSSTPIGLTCISQFSEILVYTSVLSATDRQRIEGYLAAKWGLRPSLPPSTNHPYRFGPWVGTPTQISGCALWLDAADATTLTLSGSNVTQWRDKSGNGLVATSVGNNSAVLSGTSILFTGTHGSSSTRFTIPDTASLRLTTPFTMYMVYSATALTPTSNNDFGSMILISKFVDGGSYPGWGYRARGFNGATTAIFFNSAGNQGDVVVTSSNVVDGTRKIIGLNQRTSNTMFTFVNGSADLTITPMSPPISSTDTIMIGARNTSQPTNNPFNGSLNEIIIHTGSLSRAQCEQIEGYLAWKWGLQGNLTSGGTAHPYKSFTP